MLLLSDQSLLREVVLAFLHGQHRAVLPLTHLFDFAVELRSELTLVRDGRRDFPLGLRELIAHIQNDLIQHLFRVFGPGDEIVDVRFYDRRKLRKDAHLLQPSPSELSPSAPASTLICPRCSDAAN